MDACGRGTCREMRAVVDLFQPVTGSGSPAAARTGQPATPLNGLNHDGAPASRSGDAPGARRWTGRVAGLVVGTSGAVLALVASAVLVLTMVGITMFTTTSTTSSSTESPVAGLTPGRSPAPATPAISGEHQATVAPIDAPVGSARWTPATAYSPGPPPVPVHQQPSPTAHRAPPAVAVAPPAPDHGPVVPAPSSPPSTGTTEDDDAGYWAVTTGSHTESTESRTTDTEPCDCDGGMRRIPHHGGRPSRTDRPREPRAQQVGYRSTSPASDRTTLERGEVADRPGGHHH